MLSQDTKKVFLWTLLASISFTMFSCATAPDEFYRDGIVAWNYHSLVEQRKIPAFASIRVEYVKSEPPSSETPGIGVIKLIPIVSLIPIPNTYINQMHDKNYPVYNIGGVAEQTEPLHEGEIARILTEELRKAGIARNVSSGDDQSDYIIRGNVNFSYSVNGHLSGLGFLYPVFWLIVPGSTDSFRGRAHFDVLSSNGEIVIMSKDYEAGYKLRYYLYGTSNRRWMIYGEKILPIIIRDFIRDLNTLAQRMGSRNKSI